MKRQQQIVTRNVEIYRRKFLCVHKKTNEISEVEKDFFNTKKVSSFDDYVVIKELSKEVRREMCSMSLEEFYHYSVRLPQEGIEVINEQTAS